MPGIDVAAIDAVLTEDFLPVVKDQLANETILMKRLYGRKRPSGQTKKIAVRNGRNESVGPAADGAPLANAGKSRYANAFTHMKYQYARIEVTGPAQAATQNKKALVEAIRSEVQNAKTDLGVLLNQQFFHGGYLSTAASAGTNSTTLTVKGNIHWFQQDKKIKIGSNTPVVITAVDSIAKQVTLAAAKSWSSGDVILAADTNDDTTTFLTGLRQAVDDGTFLDTFQQIQRSANAFWKGGILDKTSGGVSVDLTESAIRQAMTLAQKNGGNPTLALASFEMIDKYESLLAADRRFVNPTKVDGSFDAISFRNVPIVGDKDAPDETVFFLDESTIDLYVMKDFGWSPTTPVSGKDAVESVLSIYMNLGLSNCMKNAVLRGVKFV
jgi:hypothetical protein